LPGNFNTRQSFCRPGGHFGLRHWQGGRNMQSGCDMRGSFDGRAQISLDRVAKMRRKRLDNLSPHRHSAAAVFRSLLRALKLQHRAFDKVVMKNFLLQIFTWWNGQTMGTRFFTWRKGERVGSDDFGNVYYRERGGSRRWVIYNGYAEASTIPPGWHGWMHHRVDTPPTQEDYAPRDWQKPHQQNWTGSAGAYRPTGSQLGPGERPRVSSDYDAWTPGN
jgi:NADH:ubiquinone oxidoreductase subunit